MEDLNKFCKTEAHNKAIKLQNAAKPQTGFIASRLNKDNFWNVMFLTLSSMIVFIAQLLMNIIPAGFLLLFAAIILSPYFIAKFNAVEYKDNEFISSTTNRKLGQYAPKHLGFLIWCGIPFSAFWILLLHSKAPYLDENMALYNAIFWFIPTMYCILKNLPISMIFHKNTWVKNGNTSYSSTSRVGISSNVVDSNSFMHPNNYYRDIRNSFAEGNIYHSK